MHVCMHTCMAVTSCWCWAELFKYIHINKRSLTASTQIAKHLASLMMSSSLVEAGGCVARVEGLHMWPPHTSASLTAQQAMQDTSRRSVHWVTIISELTTATRTHTIMEARKYLIVEFRPNLLMSFQKPVIGKGCSHNVHSSYMLYCCMTVV